MFDMVRKSTRSNTRSTGVASRGRTPLQRTFAGRSSCACGGGCPRCQHAHSPQAHLEVSHPGDALEQEADRAAAQVLRTPVPSDDQDVRKDAGLRLSRYAAGAAHSSLEVPPSVSDVVSSPGEPLDVATREFMEPRFGHDLAHVRIHRDEPAVASARSVNARAYTIGPHIVFDDGEYAPSGDAGKGLLAHELTHVLQQDRSGTVAVQRREGKYPARTETSKGDQYEYPYTILKPKKLNPKGPFSAAILDLISRSYTDVGPPETCVRDSRGSITRECGPRRSAARYARLILTMLESSAEFVAMAAKLDTFYADDKNPGFRTFEAPDASQAGSKFVRAGVAYQAGRAAQASVEDVDVIMLDEGVDPRMKAGFGKSPDAEVAAAFVNVLVHETVHAFRRVSMLTKGGLKGSIEEELATRQKSSAILTAMSSASSDKNIKKELAGHITAIGASTLTLKDVGLSMTSGDEITYVESFFFDVAFSDLVAQYSKTDPTLIPGLTDLDHPTVVTLANASDYETELLGLIDRATERREVLVDRDLSLREEAAGVQSPLRTEKRPAILTAAEALRLIKLVGRTGTVKDLVDESKDVKKLSPAGLALFFHVLLMKMSLIKESLQQEHQSAGFAPTSKDHEKLSNQLAKKYLGETRPYDKL
jgi:hypothetical protein